MRIDASQLWFSRDQDKAAESAETTAEPAVPALQRAIETILRFLPPESLDLSECL